MSAFDKVKEVDERLKGKVVVEEYQKELKEWMTPEEVKKDLILYLALWRMQQGGYK